MLKTDSDEFTDRIVVKRLPPNRVSVAQLAKQTGIPRDTRYGWRARSGARGDRPATPAAPVGTLSSATPRTLPRWRQTGASAADARRSEEKRRRLPDAVDGSVIHSGPSPLSRSRTTAKAAMPSPRPVKPRRSVVVALTLTRAGGQPRSSARVWVMAGM